MLVTDLSHLTRQIAEVTLSLAHIYLLFILLSFVMADCLVPYLRDKVSVSNAKNHARHEALGCLVSLLEHIQGETILH